MRSARILALLAGLGLTGWLVWKVGPSLLAEELSRLGWWWPLLLLPQILVTVVDAWGWRYAFPGRLPRVGPLIPIRLAGEAVNATTPTGTVGGDAVKAWLCARTGTRVPLADGLVSVVVAKTALFGSQVVFCALALGVACTWLGGPPGVTTLLTTLTLVGLVASGGFWWSQQRGLFRLGSRILLRLGVAERAAVAAGRLDEDLRAYYRGRPVRFALANVLHLVGWVAGVIEVWLALAFLGAPVPFTTALVIEAGVTGVRSASFLVPASAGVQEGGFVGICLGLGLGAGTGLSLGVVRRLREGLWATLGYLYLATWRRRPEHEPPRSS